MHISTAAAALIFARACIPPGGITDPDGDWLTNSQERELGTDPRNPDTDEDLLMDNEELVAQTDPLNPDTDGDELMDGEEVLYGRDPLVDDSPDPDLSPWLDTDSHWRTRGDTPLGPFVIEVETRPHVSVVPDDEALPVFSCVGGDRALQCLTGFQVEDGADGTPTTALYDLEADLDVGDAPLFLMRLTRTAPPDDIVTEWTFTAVPLASTGQ